MSNLPAALQKIFVPRTRVRLTHNTNECLTNRSQIEEC